MIQKRYKVGIHNCLTFQKNCFHHLILQRKNTKTTMFSLLLSEYIKAIYYNLSKKDYPSQKTIFFLKTWVLKWFYWKVKQLSIPTLYRFWINTFLVLCRALHQNEILIFSSQVKCKYSIEYISCTVSQYFIICIIFCSMFWASLWTIPNIHFWQS